MNISENHPWKYRVVFLSDGMGKTRIRLVSGWNAGRIEFRCSRVFLEVDSDIDRNGKRSYNGVPKVEKCFENNFRFLPEGPRGEPSYSPRLNCAKDSLLSDVRLPGGNLSLFGKPLPRERGFFGHFSLPLVFIRRFGSSLKSDSRSILSLAENFSRT